MERINNNNKGWLRRFFIGASAAFLIFFLVTPLVYIVFAALSEGWSAYVRAVSDKFAIRSALLTLEATTIAVVVNAVFGICAAWSLTKFSFRGKKLLATLIDLPVTVSPIVAGLVFLLTFGRQSFLYPYLSKFGIQIVFAVPGVILATVFVTFPFISRELIPVLSAQGSDEEEAAALMGAGTWTIFSKVTFPHIKWSLLYGVVLCAARAMGEFGAVSVLSGSLRGKTDTLPLYVEELYQGYEFVGAFAVSSILVVFTAILLVLRVWLEKKGGKELDAAK